LLLLDVLEKDTRECERQSGDGVDVQLPFVTELNGNTQKDPDDNADPASELAFEDSRKLEGTERFEAIFLLCYMDNES